MNTAALKAELTQILSKGNDAASAAEDIANALEKWVKSAQVNTIVTGTSAGTAVTGTGTGTIS